LTRFVASAAELREARAVVLDLRGNGGGSDAFLRDFFLRLTDRPLSYFRSRLVTSEVTLQGDVNFWRCMSQRPALARDGQRWIGARLAQARRNLHGTYRERDGAPFRYERRQRTVTRGHAPGPFSGVLILWVDAGCASACEAAVMYARQFPGTIVVGENTAGAEAYTEIRSYRLPESGVWVTAGMKELVDPGEGGFAEGRGYLPDLWLVPGHGGHAEERVGHLARCLGRPECRDRVEARLSAYRARIASP
jgi:C-terminal processing protease CtpA/Prc